jgi:hypothetical protein
LLLFLNILCRCETIFTDTSKDILLVIGISFAVSLGPDEHLQIVMSGWGEVSDRRRSPLFTASRWLGTFDSKSYPNETRFSEKDTRKAVKYICAFCAAVNATEKQTFHSIFSTKTFLFMQ